MSTYLNKCFIEHIKKEDINIIFELGSRDLLDAIELKKYYNKAKIYAFECNPDSIIECEKNKINDINLIKKAVSIENNNVDFYPFDRTKYDNIGASSMFLIDFTKRNKNDPDYNRENPQYKITVEGIRLDKYMNDNNIDNIDLLCMDLQEYELNALKSLGDKINKVKYIITECCINNTYINGTYFKELNEFLIKNNFIYISNDGGINDINEFNNINNLNDYRFYNFLYKNKNN